jgi:hypothetical protein
VARRVRPDQRGTRALELAMVNREAALGKGARLLSTSHVPLEPSWGERHDMTHAGGRSLAEERLGEAAAILRISRRRKPCTEGFFGN